jgi:hypothetical protein
MKSLIACLFLLVVASYVRAAEPPDYTKDVLPILNKYCNGCHNADDREGKLDLGTYATALKGGAKGAVITPGSGEQSRLIRVLTGQAKPAMPPEDNERPKDNDVAILKSWIDAGAKGPSGAAPDPTDITVPHVKPSVSIKASINALALSPSGDTIALAKFGEVELVSAKDGALIKKFTGLRGRVNAIAFSRDGALLVAGAGEPALIGEAKVWKVATGELLRTYRGHKDCLYAVAISPGGDQIATAGYDQTIKLWSLDSDEPLRSLDGHNGAIFAMQYRPDGRVLASASDDRTVKLWNPATGERLDTLSQSTKELYTLAISPDGKRLAAAGVDNRIRVWGLSDDAKEGTNPLVFSQFAHDGAVLKIAYAADGEALVSTAEDKLIKVWNATNMTIRATSPAQPDWVSGVAILPAAREVVLSRLDGEMARFVPAASDDNAGAALTQLPEVPPAVDYGPQPPVDQLPKVAEVEPNDRPDQAMALNVPAIATGRIHVEGSDQRQQDSDLFRFSAKAGDQWIIEVNAARTGSPLDSKVSVLHGDGRPVERLLLRALRDSELEFRGMSSDQRGARLKYWEEIPLRQYVYLSGEVVKQFQQRRGPDADNQFYPEGGNRIGYFDTTARAHALAEPCYVVAPYAIGTQLPNNGLPTFTLNYENDDDAQRKLGKDSRLTFVAPADGDYLLKVSDVRGFGGEKFSYAVTVRRPQPGFKVSLTGGNPTVGAGSGKIFVAKAERLDNFNGPITVDVTGAPAGFTIMSPLVIEEGHFEAKGVVAAHASAPMTTDDDWARLKVAASAEVAGKTVTQDVNNLGMIKLADKPKVVVHVLPVEKTPAELAPPLAAPQRTFKTLTPAEFKSAGGAKLNKLDDDSLLASEANPDTDTYTVTATTNARGIRAIRLDVLGDDSLPGKAPGRANPNGNFVLSEFSVTAAAKSDPAKTAPVKLKSVAADYVQPGWSAAGMLDGNPKTGWAIAESGPNNTFPVKKTGDNPSHHAIFELAEPLTIEGETILTFTLAQTSDVKQHNVGRFKFSITTDETVAPALDFPPLPEVSIVPGRETQVRLKVERNGFNDRIPIEVENLPHGVIVNDIGLSGVLINPGETERVIFLYCEPWVAAQSRTFVAVAKVEGDQVSLPMTLHVKRP